MNIDDGKLNIIKGDLIELAKAGEFDVIAHGCNCFCTQKKGLALQMAKTFETDKYLSEEEEFKGDIHKLGAIQWVYKQAKNGNYFAVVNAYTQYHWTPRLPHAGKPLSMEALVLCLQKINHEFKGKHIGLPKIGCGLAGGHWPTVKILIRNYLQDCKVTIVEYE